MLLAVVASGLIGVGIFLGGLSVGIYMWMIWIDDMNGIVKSIFSIDRSREAVKNVWCRYNVSRRCTCLSLVVAWIVWGSGWLNLILNSTIFDKRLKYS